ncbi:MAG TPA: M3 family metallopeptidase, partial [Elusimicrobiota bacterium]|nr:M3 family metallopeptidase [Elusimicrobiota bacterium]
MLPFDVHAKPAAIDQACKAAMDKANAALAGVARMSVPKSTSTDNALLAFSRVLADLGDETATPMFLGHVAQDKDSRDAGTACEAAVSRYSVEVYSREDLYKPILAYAKTHPALEGEDARLLEKTLLDFRRSGLDLPAAQRERAKALKQKISDVQVAFAKSLGEWKDAALFSRRQLKGLPEDFVARLPEQGGRYRVSLDYPDYFPFMDDAKDAAARRELETRFDSRGGAENSARMADVLKLRAETASLLGYPTWAHYQLEDRMA